MQPCQQGTEDPSLLKPSLSPYLANSLQVEGDSGFAYGSACYNQKHNMIVAYPISGIVQFYDATTFLPLETRGNLELDSSVASLSYNEKTDAYILGSIEGSLYLYNAASQELRKLRECEAQAMAISFMNAGFFAFSLLGYKKLYLGTVGFEGIAIFDSNYSDPFCLLYLEKRNLLVSGLTNGSVVVYRTNELPHLRIISSFQAHQETVLAMQNVNHKGKEYIFTVSMDRTVKIWHLMKRRTRLLRVVYSEEMPYSLAYLEEEKMLVIGYESKEIRFWKFPRMKLESTVCLSNDGVKNVFWMKEKKTIGATNEGENIIDFIKLE